jgi:hypothetical protein
MSIAVADIAISNAVSPAVFDLPSPSSSSAVADEPDCGTGGDYYKAPAGLPDRATFEAEMEEYHTGLCWKKQRKALSELSLFSIFPLPLTLSTSSVSPVQGSDPNLSAQ